MFGRGNFGRPIQKNSMSIQKEQTPQKFSENKITLHNFQSNPQNLKTPFNGNGALVQQRFNMILKQQSPDTTQAGILLKFTIPAYAGQRKRWLKVKKSQLAYVNFLDDDYPCFYSLCAMQVDGIMDKSGAPTKQIVTMPLQQLTTNISSDFMTLNLLYQTQDKDQYLIDITSVTSLNFYIQQQLKAEKVALPLATHLLLQFSIFRSLV